MGSIQTMIKLKSFLNPRNLQYLSALLHVVLRDDEVGKRVWNAFGKQFTSPAAAEEARVRLVEIKRLVDEVRGK